MDRQIESKCLALAENYRLRRARDRHNDPDDDHREQHRRLSHGQPLIRSVCGAAPSNAGDIKERPGRLKKVVPVFCFRSRAHAHGAAAARKACAGRQSAGRSLFTRKEAPAFLISVKPLAISLSGDYNLQRIKHLEENMKKSILAWLLSLALILSLAGCANARPSESEAPAAEAPVTENVQTPAENDGQNPVMNFVGVYHAEDCIEALVEAEGSENAKITVTWAGSPWFQNRTVMSGAFDSDTLTVSFSDAALTEYTYSSDGSVAEAKVSYENGTGRAVFSPEDNTLTITEEFPSGDYDTVFTWGSAPDMKKVSEADHYAPVTAMDKFKVETEVGFAVRTAYLEEDWYALAGMIRYPITINGTELADEDAFLEYMKDKTVHESDRQAMMEEDFLDMFVNGQGICMGSGQVWLNDPNYMTDQEPVLQIIALSGIVRR